MTEAHQAAVSPVSRTPLQRPASRLAIRLAGMALAATALIAAPAAAGPFSYLQGLGVNISTAMDQIDRPSLWAPSAGGVWFMVEDNVGPGGVVGPGLGGQPYDLEALYVQRTATQLIITGVSGAPIAWNPAAGTSSATCTPPACNSSFGIGDFFLGVRQAGAFAPKVGVEVVGHHFTIDNLGFTNGWTSPLQAGGIVNVSGVATSPTPTNPVGWDIGLAQWQAEGAPAQIAAGYTTGFNLGRLATMAYETIGQHTAYQATVKLADLGSLNGSGDIVVHWGEACGNDFLRVDVPGVSVASPASLPLTGLALMAAAAAAAAARRRRSAARADAANA